MQLPGISRRRALLYLAAAALALGLGGRALLGRSGPPAPAGAAAVAAQTALEAAPAESAPAEPPLVVDVVGAVRRPGLYRLPAGSRVDDAVRRAGGPTRKAAIELVNLAAPLADGQQVVVPAQPQAAAGGAVAAGAAQASGPVHLNSATVEELDTLPGVGPVTAQKIVDYRTEHGPFRSVDELDAIPGIGPARLEQLRDLVAP
jgi:competence protein ComEA